MKVINWINKEIKSNSFLIFSSLFVTFTLFLFAPITLYLSNADEFWFNLYHISGIVVATTVIGFIVITSLGILIKSLLGDKVSFIYETLIFSIGICIYVHSNFLNLRVGDFDGAQIDWGRFRTDMIKNLAIWIIIIAICFVVRIVKVDFIKNYLKFLPLFLTVLEVTALVSMIVTTAGNDIWNRDIKVYSDADICDMGDEDNIIVFVLDMFDAVSIRQLLEKEPEIFDEMDGFRIYDNYAGMYRYTNPAMDDIVNNRSYIDALFNDGYEVSIYTDINTAIKPELMEKLRNYTEKTMYFRNIRTKLVLIYKMVACQYMPDIVKPYVWLYGDEFNKACVSDDDFNHYITDNGNFRNLVAHREFNVNKGVKSFKIIHTFGGHDPFYIDADGNDVDPYFDDYYAACRGSFKIMQGYLNKMKANGTYDNSSIIVTADHGWRSDHYGLLTSPMMMIKVKDSHGPVTISNAPVCQDDLPATILKLAGDTNYNSYGTAIMDVPEDSKRERLTYSHSVVVVNGVTENFGTIEYSLKPESNDWDSFVLTGKEISPSGREISHFDNCKTCKEGTEPVDDYGWKSLIHYATDEYINQERKGN